MNNNLMPEVAKLLGVEIGEEFNIQGLSGGPERFKTILTETGLVFPDFKALNDGGDNTYLAELLKGNLEYEKMPWEPKEDEPYWTISFFKKHRPYAENYVWNGDDMDFTKLKLGMVYRTQAEAEAHLAEDYERLIGKKLSSVE